MEKGANGESVVSYNGIIYLFTEKKETILVTFMKPVKSSQKKKEVYLEMLRDMRAGSKHTIVYPKSTNIISHPETYAMLTAPIVEIVYGLRNYINTLIKKQQKGK